MQPLRRHILCVDDDDDTCFMLSHLLAGEGFEAKTAASVDEALKLARKESFNMYILDEWFPRGTGTSLCRKIREFDPHTPIIIYSGAAFETEQQEALHAGANAFVPKPHVEKLVETIRRLFGFEAEPSSATKVV
ncbi:MAG TPA: response regulator [Pyrinomonadaceae bacterium]